MSQTPEPTTPEVTSAPAIDEVVTQALLRIVDLPENSGRIALITLDNQRDHTKPNTFGVAGLASLDRALDGVAAAAETGQVIAVAVTGKPFVFAVGADLTGVQHVRTREQAHQLGVMGHGVFRRFSDLGIPSFAFVNGAALGGGLELALHCDFRTLSTAAGLLGLPEVSLGLVPAWGGAYLLPQLIGARKSIEVIVENPLNQNRMLRPSQALSLGIADVGLDPADFLAESLRWAGRVIRGEILVQRTPVDRGEEWEHAVGEGRELIEARLHGSAPAAARALDLIEAARTSSRDSAFAAEDTALSDLVMGEELRASLYAFDLVQRRAKRPTHSPDMSMARSVTKVGIVGTGLMASQLALLFVQRLQIPVVLTDLDQDRVDAGLARVHDDIDLLAAKGRISADKANRLRALVTGSISHESFVDADAVVEAVFEDLLVKRQVFAALESIVAPTCVLLTNTSSLSISAMSEGLAHPERVVGFHFFNPVALMPLLEIATTPVTDDVSLATAFSLGRAIGKSCVLVKDSPGFVVNRILARLLGEVTAAFDEGTSFEVADSALDPLGLPMSPYLLLQMVGPAVALHVAGSMTTAFPDRFHVSENQRRIVDAGITQLLTWDGPTPRLTNDVAALLEVGTSSSSPAAVLQRAVDALAQEIRIMLEEGVVTEVQDLDLCLILGAGWPFHNGGITPYLDRCGASERVNGRRFLEPGIASVPSQQP